MEQLTLNDYQIKSQETAIYPRDNNMDLIYTTLGLAGEAGEIANKVKKIIRDNNGDIPYAVREALVDELGDVLWYVAAVADSLLASLDQIAFKNLVKLQSRKDRGKIGGSGDTR